MQSGVVVFASAPPVEVEVPETHGEYAFGLSERHSIPVGTGMLFDFGPSPDATPAMWMRRTYEPLDMIFMDGGGTVIGIVHSAKPLSSRMHGYHGARYVLEVPGGWARAYGVGRGDRAFIQS